MSALLCFPSTFVRIVYFQRQTSGISSIIPRAIVAYSSCLVEFLICIANLGFSSDDITNVKIMSTIHAHEFAERKPGFSFLFLFSVKPL